MNGPVSGCVVPRALMDGPIPVKWEPDDSSPTCRLCGGPFTFFRRRHHCRACGKLVCDRCSQSRLHLADAISRRERVCMLCADRTNKVLFSDAYLRQRTGFSYTPSVKFRAFLMLCKMPHRLGRLAGSPAFQVGLRRIWELMQKRRPRKPVV